MVVSGCSRGGSDPLRDRLRQPNLWQDGVGLAQLVKELAAEQVSPQLATALGRVMLNTGGDAAPAAERGPGP